MQHMSMKVFTMNKYLFKGNKEIIKCLTRYLEVKIFMPEAEIISEGDSAGHLYFLSKGDCEVLIKDERKKDQISRYLSAGHIFGEIALIYRCRRTATIRTMNYCNCTSITRYEFFSIGQAFPEFF